MTEIESFRLETLEKVMGEKFVREKVVLGKGALDSDLIGLAFDVGEWLENCFARVAACYANLSIQQAVLDASELCRPEKIASHARLYEQSRLCSMSENSQQASG